MINKSIVNLQFKGYFHTTKQKARLHDKVKI